MKMIHWFLSLCLLPCAMANQAPWARPDISISGRDRVYTAAYDQMHSGKVRFRVVLTMGA